VETGFELKFLGEWKGGYALRGLRNRLDNVGLPLAAEQRTYLRWTTPEMRPIKALSFRLIPVVHYFSGFDEDVDPSTFRKDVGLVNIKTVGAVKNFNFFYSVENLFDRQYYMRGDLPQPGRSWFFGFNWSLWD
jgi:hypothetical protein